MLGVLFFECQPNDINQYHSYTEQSELSSCISQSCLPTSCIPPWSKTGRFRNRPPARFAAPGGDFLVPRATFKRKTACWKTAKKKTFPNNDGNTAVFTAQHDFFCGCRGTSVWEIQGAVRLLSGFPLEKLTTNNLSGCPGGSAKKEPECSCIVALELWQCRGNWCHKNDVSKLIGTGRATSDRDPTYWVTEFRLL